MDYKEVEQLLDKFYNAHTTCPEEQNCMTGYVLKNAQKNYSLTVK